MLKNKKTEPAMMAHDYNPSTWEVDTGGSYVQGQPQLLSETFCNIVRPCFKIKDKK